MTVLRNGALRLTGAVLGAALFVAACALGALQYLILNGGHTPWPVILVQGLGAVAAVMLAVGWLFTHSRWQWRTRLTCLIALGGALVTGLATRWLLIAWRGERVSARVTEARTTRSGPRETPNCGSAGSASWTAPRYASR